MKVLVFYDGPYGRRFFDNISGNGPPHWEVEGYHYNGKIPPAAEVLEEYLPQGVPSCDLLIAVQERPVVAELIPLFIKKTGAAAVIAPIDSKAYLTSGLARQLKKKLEKLGVELVSPMTFCVLTEKSSENGMILEFVQYFGRPKVRIEVAQDKVGAIAVLRDAPCGNTRYVAEHLVGTHQRDAVEKSGIIHHNHPCMASMAMDAELGDTLMHHSGLQIKLAVEEALKNSQEK